MILLLGIQKIGLPQVVISQIYGGGGNTNAIYKNDFIELFNRGAVSVNITGWSVQYTSAAGSSWASNQTNITSNVTLAPGQYFLIQEGSGGSVGVTLPTADLTGTIGLSATAGKIALVSSTTALTGTCPTGGSIIDFVGYGSGASCYEGSAAAPAPSNTTAILRASNGCQDNNINSTDFSTGTPLPRNTATTFNPCSNPIITISASALTGFSYSFGTGPSAEQTFNVSGSNLSGPISIVGTTDFEISLSPGTGYTTPLVLTPSSGSVSSTPVYVRLKTGLAIGTYSSELINLTSAGATSKTVSCSGSVTSPALTVGTITGFGDQVINTTSAEKNYAVTGSNLSGNVVIVPPAGFEISTWTGAGFVATNPIILSPSSGSVNSTVYVRFSPSVTGSYSGNITHNSSGAAQQNVAVSGNGIYNTPSNHVSGFAATVSDASTISLSWLDNNGSVPASGFLILANTTGTFAAPVNGTPQTDDAVLSDGSGILNIAPGVQSCSWTGLSANTIYYFVIYPYSNAGTSILYKTTPAAPQSSSSIQIITQTIAAWVFDNTLASPGTPTSVPADLGTQAGTANLYADGTNGSSSWSQASELSAFSGTTLNDPRVGSTFAGMSYSPQGGSGISANGKSMIIKFSMAGYQDPILSFATRGTSTGFTTHQWAWSTDNVSYTNFGTNTANTTATFLTRTLDMSSINNLDQASTVYLRITYSGATSSSGNNRIDNIVLTATSATSAPLTQAHDLVFSNVAGTSMTVGWTNGSGSKRCVVINTSNSFTTPLNGTDPPASSIYAGSGEQVVFNGTGNTVNVSGLSSSTTYWFKVFEFNGTGTGSSYCTASGVNNPMSQLTLFVAGPPHLSSPTASAISTNSGIIGGTILNDGGSPLLERGTIWSINSPVAITDNKLAEGGTTTGSFSHLRSGLPSGTEIFYAIYATNALGTAISSQSSFFTLADEPDSQAINFTSATPLSSSITITWTDNDGIQPATGFLVLANTTGTFTAPVDGVPQTDDLVLNDGNAKVNISHGQQSFTWTGLNPSTTYYFSIYPYTNSGSSIDYKNGATAPVTTATTTGAVYSWIGSDNGAWTTATNWSPLRATPSSNDILQFNDGTTRTVTAVPNQTVAKLIISGNSKVTFAGSNTLTISGTLNLSGGLLSLSSANLLLGPSAFIAGAPSASAMIIPTGTGQLRKEIPSAGGSFTFPVGDNTGTPEYSPVTISFTTGSFGTGNYVGISLSNSMYPGIPSGVNYLNRYWALSSSGISGFNCNALFNYPVADVTGNEGFISCVQMTPSQITYGVTNAILHQLTAGNLSSFGTFTGSQVDKSLILTLFLEGLYAGNGIMNKAQDISGNKFPGNTADQVIVDLHSGDAGNYSTIEYSSGLINLSTSGQAELPVPATHSGAYYITIRHRNSISTTTALPVSFSGNSISYNFSDNSTKAFGNNLITSGDGRYLIYGGDVNQDGYINQLDMEAVRLDSEGFLSGYISSDVNGDDVVDESDMIIIDNNTANTVSTLTP
ncbi:MAG: lamin tail domain-containing protein [Bacteroidetes bacterium]|nr:lamin tail domain-containing protein [Bacteroidota bacterium]